MEELTKTDRATVRRLPARGSHDLQTICAILDEGLVAHVGFISGGQPFVIPMSYGRDGRRLFVHGSVASRAMKSAGTSAEVCLTVTILDGLVLARSLFHHSMNYRSVVVFGKARLLAGEEEKLHALRIISEHIAPGRWDVARKPNERELRATAVLELPLDEASAKIRRGGPADEEEDMDLPVWAGEVALRLTPVSVEPAADLRPGLPAPVLEQFARV